jgi:predicted RND superfamily exporter protein
VFPLPLYDAVVLRHPRTVVAFLVAVLGFAGYWIKDFQLDASADSLVLEHDDDLRYSRSIDRRYGGEEFVVVTYTPPGDLLGEASLEELKRLRADLDAIDRVASVTTLLDVPLLRNPPVPLTEVRDNLKALEDPETDVELARGEFLTSPVYRNLIVSRDLESTALQVTFRTDEDHAALSQRRQELVDRRLEGPLSTVEERYSRSKDRLRDELHDDIVSIRAILDRYRGDSRLFLGGVPMIVDDIVSFIRTDLAVFGVGMVLLLIATLGVIFRHARWVTLPMLCCASSAVAMMGLLGFIGWEVTVVSSNFISLQLIFTMSLTIHLIVRYRELLRLRPDEDNHTLIRETVRHTFVPCLYASLTTIAGFSSLILCDILPVMNFGWMMTMGVTVSLAVVFVLFPATLILMPKRHAAKEKDFGLFLTRGLGRFTEHRGTAVLSLGALVAALTIVGATQLRVENSFIDYFKESTEIYRGMEFIDRELGGTTPLDVILDFPPAEEEEVADAQDAAPAGEDEFDEFAEFDEFELVEEEGDREKYWFTTTKLSRVGKVHDYLDALPETGKVSSLATLSKLGRDINGGEPLDDFLLAILFQKMPDDFKEALVAPYASIEHDQARINIRIVDSMETLRRDAFLKSIRRDLQEQLGLREDQFRLTGLMVLYNNMLQSLFDSQIKTIGYTVLALTTMFLLLFRSLKIALIAIFPSLLSSLTVLGVMGLGNIPLDVMTITIVAISVGIAVDDTIHYLHRFKREFEKDRDYVQTMHRCHGSIGSAMYYTSITITIGFSILAISKFIPSVVFGLLTALAMTMALISALSLLPKLIISFQPFGPPAGDAGSPAPEVAPEAKETAVERPPVTA